MSDTIIKIENLSKAYRLGVINHGMLYKDIQSWWARKRGKEDPHSKLDMYNREQLDREDRFWALKDINLEVRQGDRVGIIGKNGAGKSTLLKVLSRVTAPTTGSVKVKGRIASLLEVGTGFHPELTGRENIYLNGAILGMTKAEISRKFDEIVDFAGIEKFIDTPVKRYSSGMYVRLAFAVAAHLEPEILVVDEVLAVGDAEFQKKAVSKMSEVSKNDGKTILFVSHNMGLVSRLCTSGLLLSKGNLVSIGDMNDLIRIYLQTDVREKAVVELPIVNNERAHFTRIGLQNDYGDWINEFSLGDNITVIIEFDIPETEDDQVMLAMQIETSNGYHIANVIDKDSLFIQGYQRGINNIRIRFHDVR